MRDRLLLVLVVAAEAGHLVAAWTEAEAWPLISGFHITVACCLGFVLGGLRKPRPRAGTYRWLMVLGVSLPVLYVFTRLLGVPTYVTFTRLPIEAIGITVSMIEVALTALLATNRHTGVPGKYIRPRQSFSPETFGLLKRGEGAAPRIRRP